MHGRISTWRFRPEEYDRFEESLAPALAEMRRQPGFIAGYGVRTSPDSSMTFTVWESEEQLEAGMAAVTTLLRPLLEDGQIELVDRKSGPAQELGTTSRL